MVKSSSKTILKNMHSANKSYLCVIPARKGSKGIKNKNLQIVKRIPLIEHTLIFAKKIEKYCDIVVSSDSKKILKIGNKYNFISNEIRPKNISKDNAETIDVVKYEVKRLEKIKKKIYNYVLLLQPTVPFRNLKNTLLAIRLITSKRYDSIISIKNVEANHPYRMKIIRNGFLKNFCSFKKENMKPRQLLPDVYIRAGSFYLIKRNTLFKNNSLVGKKVYGVEIFGKERINIDNKKDLLNARKS